MGILERDKGGILGFGILGSPKEQPFDKRMDFWLDRLLRKIDEAAADESAAIIMYGNLRSEVAAVFPPGTQPYDIIKKIEEEERVHFRQLDEIRQTILKKKQEIV